MERVRQRLESTRHTRDPAPLSPTAFPGADAVEEATASVEIRPLFPDMRRDEFMSKSTISSKEASANNNNNNNNNNNATGDYWSVSTASEERFRPQQQQQPMNRDSRRFVSRSDEREFESREHEPRVRNDHSLERRTRERPVKQYSKGRSQGQPSERFDADEYEVPYNQYDDGYGDRTSARHGERQGDRFLSKQRMERKPHVNTRHPQHLYADYDEFGSARPERLDPRSPRIASPRQPTTTRSERGPRSERGHDTDYYHRRVISPTRTDYARAVVDEDEAYERHMGRGRSKSPLYWKGSARVSNERPRFREDSSDDDDVFTRPRATSRRRSTSREMGRIGRSQYTTPYDSISRGRDGRPAYEDFHRESDRSRTRNYQNEADEDDESTYGYPLEVVQLERKSRRTVRYEEDTDDDSSVSSLNVERGTSRRLEQSVDPRSRSRGRSRGFDVKAQRQRSKSRDRKEPTEFIIDIAQSFDDYREVTFSPSTEVPCRTSLTSVSHTSEDHSKRIADANLLKEQSEARHQILKEIRQAMEMRDLTRDSADRQFWDRQVNTLNASLKTLWDHHIAHNGGVGGGSEYGRNFNDVSSMPVNVLDTRAAVNNYTTVKVQAPDNLPAGHQFTIRVNGKPMKAQVPAGGVRKGDVFTIRIPLNAPTTPTAGASSSLSTIKVRAPASLPAGYRFTAKMGDRTIIATVPPGGVQKGEIFAVPIDG